MMGKRSKFKRVEKDYYPTPAKALEPLVQHLPEVFTFCEPCAGDGRLIRHIQQARPRAECVMALDIEPHKIDILQADALEIDEKALKADFIITNPPWTRQLLHPLIDRFASIAPTWLLFDADWAYTKQARQFTDYLKIIQVVGRVKWIEASEFSGKDNVSWYLFDKNSPQTETKFYV
jgi:methylase of polypeptide subunit release factors